jgi:hypothetical protein
VPPFMLQPIAAAVAAFFWQAARIAGVHCAAIAGLHPEPWAAVLRLIASAEQPPSAGTLGTRPLLRVADTVLAEVADDAPDLDASHALAAAATHVLARSSTARSRSGFMEPTSRKVMKTRTRPVRADPERTLEASAGQEKACHRALWPVSRMCKNAAQPPVEAQPPPLRDASCEELAGGRTSALTLAQGSP